MVKNTEVHSATATRTFLQHPLALVTESLLPHKTPPVLSPGSVSEPHLLGFPSMCLADPGSPSGAHDISHSLLLLTALELESHKPTLS